jgi:hypothetical protein
MTIVTKIKWRMQGGNIGVGHNVGQKQKKHLKGA